MGCMIRRPRLGGASCAAASGCRPMRRTSSPAIDTAGPERVRAEVVNRHRRGTPSADPRQHIDLSPEISFTVGCRSAPIGTPPHHRLLNCFKELSRFRLGSHSGADLQSGRISTSTTASGRIRALTHAHQTEPTSMLCRRSRQHEFRRRWGASLRSGYALPARRPPTATHTNNRQNIHLSKAKRCSDKPGHLNYYSILDHFAIRAVPGASDSQGDRITGSCCDGCGCHGARPRARPRSRRRETPISPRYWTVRPKALASNSAARRRSKPSRLVRMTATMRPTLRHSCWAVQFPHWIARIRAD